MASETLTTPRDPGPPSVGAVDVSDVGLATAVPEATATGPGPGRVRILSDRMFDSLAERSFRWYFASMFGWFASMNMQMLVRGFVVYELTGSYAALGLVSLANAIPGLFLSLPGGVLADRLKKKTIIQIGQSSNLIVSAVIAFLMLSDRLVFEHLLVCAVLQGGINALLMPARQSMIPEIVPGVRLMNAVALSSAGMNVMRLLAPAVGGLLLAVAGPGWVYMTMAGLYGMSALLLAPVRNADHVRTAAVPATLNQGHGHVSGGLSDIVEGWRYIRRDSVVFMILGVNLLIVLVSMPYQMLLPGFAKEVLDAGPGRLGLLMSITGVGSLVGSLGIAAMPERNRGLVLILSSLVLGISLVAFSASSWYWVTAAIMITIGVGQAGRMSLSNVLLQSYTQSQYRGRVMSIYMLEFSLVSFGTFLVGIMANFLGPQVALGGTSVALIVLAAALLLTPKMRNLP